MDLYLKKRSTNVPKKVFLVTNISSLLAHFVPVKYKNLETPIIFYTMSMVIDRALLDLGAHVNLLSYSVY